MKIGYFVDINGKVVINDKNAEARNRGTQYNLPKPELGKKATVLILSEDLIPSKKRGAGLDIHKNLEKILDNYDTFKELDDKKTKNEFNSNSSKNYVWGFPKQNPNAPKKYYSKKNKK